MNSGGKNFGGKEEAKRRQRRVRLRTEGKRERERRREGEDEDRGQKGGKIETKRKGESILG